MTALYIGNDMMVRFAGDGKLTDDNGNAVTGATVHATLYEHGTTTPVDGVDWPVVLADQGAGVYAGIIPDTVQVVERTRYDMVITAEKDEADAVWRETVKANYRVFRN